MNCKYLNIVLGIIVIGLIASNIITFTNLKQSNEKTQEPLLAEELQQNSALVEEDFDPTEISPTTNTLDTKVIPWKLTKGDVSDTCTDPTFSGQVTLKGRYVWDTSYVSNQWLFKITADQLKLLPLDQLKLGSYYKDKPQFILKNVSTILEEELKLATDFDPQEITITQFNQYCEGSANLTVK